uniref:Uncharacterized protein n=1 Tax=Pithovirus LCPAC404 TaxID=2506597 RepID=A0A481ZCE9_9VIRU|nr:MAG: uncharacterized protein LCPAC404_03170 [Pithovirus LCPAC404]
MTSSTPVDNTIITGGYTLEVRKYKSIEECDAVIYRSMGGEPKSYKLSDSALLETNEKEWENIWKEHVKFHDMALRQIQFEHDANQFSYDCLSTIMCEDYVDLMHLKMRSIMLERRLRKVEDILSKF